MSSLTLNAPLQSQTPMSAAALYGGHHAPSIGQRYQHPIVSAPQPLYNHHNTLDLQYSVQQGSLYHIPHSNNTAQPQSHFALHLQAHQHQQQPYQPQQSLQDIPRPEYEFKSSPFFSYRPNEVKHRKRTTRQQLKVLEETFKKTQKPDGSLRKTLALQLNMTPRNVQVWFQNRRAKDKTLAKRALEAERLKEHGSTLPNKVEESDSLTADAEGSEAPSLGQLMPIAPISIESVSQLKMEQPPSELLLAQPLSAAPTSASTVTAMSPPAVHAPARRGSLSAPTGSGGIQVPTLPALPNQVPIQSSPNSRPPLGRRGSLPNTRPVPLDQFEQTHQRSTSSPTFPTTVTQTTNFFVSHEKSSQSIGVQSLYQQQTPLSQQQNVDVQYGYQYVARSQDAGPLPAANYTFGTPSPAPTYSTTSAGGEAEHDEEYFTRFAQCAAADSVTSFSANEPVSTSMPRVAPTSESDGLSSNGTFNANDELTAAGYRYYPAHRFSPSSAMPLTVQTPQAAMAASALYADAGAYRVNNTISRPQSREQLTGSPAASIYSTGSDYSNGYTSSQTAHQQGNSHGFQPQVSYQQGIYGYPAGLNGVVHAGQQSASESSSAASSSLYLPAVGQVQNEFNTVLDDKLKHSALATTSAALESSVQLGFDGQYYNTTQQVLPAVNMNEPYIHGHPYQTFGMAGVDSFGAY